MTRWNILKNLYASGLLPEVRWKNRNDDDDDGGGGSSARLNSRSAAPVRLRIHRFRRSETERKNRDEEEDKDQPRSRERCTLRSRDAREKGRTSVESPRVADSKRRKKSSLIPRERERASTEGKNGLLPVSTRDWPAESEGAS